MSAASARPIRLRRCRTERRSWPCTSSTCTSDGRGSRASTRTASSRHQCCPRAGGRSGSARARRPRPNNRQSEPDYPCYANACSTSFERTRAGTPAHRRIGARAFRFGAGCVTGHTIAIDPADNPDRPSRRRSATPAREHHRPAGDRRTRGPRPFDRHARGGSYGWRPGMLITLLLGARLAKCERPPVLITRARM